MEDVHKAVENRYNLDKEKLVWLQEIGAKELKEPYVYSADYGHYYMSERYLRETPLCKIKEFYEKIRLNKRNEILYFSDVVDDVINII